MNQNLNTEQLYKDNVLGNYGLPPVTFTRGRGLRLWDDSGKEYLDFCSAIAVTSIGHSHPKLVEAIQSQAAEALTFSNLYRNEKQALLASRLNEKAGGGGKVFFCNSGAEANEALIKLSRLYGQKLAGEEGKRYKVVCAESAFHGRTFGGMSATPQAKIQKGFAPLVDGFAFAELNNLASFEAAIDEETSAVFIETIQGEGGIFPATVEFLQGLRKLCDEKGVLLMLDEVQCGIGRTGSFYAFEKAGIRPDAIGMAKGLGGGVPVGAVWIDDQYADLFGPGSHGTTFGGTPLICSACLAVLDTIEKENLLERVSELGCYVMDKLEALKAELPEYILQIRGEGYMIGIQIAEAPLDMVTLLREKGLIVPPAGTDVVRFLPALTASKEDFDEALTIFSEAARERASLIATEAAGA